MRINDLIPEADVLLGLTPEELAGVLLEPLLAEGDGSSLMNRYNISLGHTTEGYPAEKRVVASVALMEAWSWLEREGMLVQKPGSCAAPSSVMCPPQDRDPRGSRMEHEQIRVCSGS
jgi:hypothetical protein